MTWCSASQVLPSSGLTYKTSGKEVESRFNDLGIHLCHQVKVLLENVLCVLVA